MQGKHISDCYQYTLDRLKELSNPYVEQLKKTEDFARWNLPDDFAEDWSNMGYFIEILYSNHKIDEKTKCLLYEICCQFNKYSYGEPAFSSEVWSHDAMRSSIFWTELRNLAKQALEHMESA